MRKTLIYLFLTVLFVPSFAQKESVSTLQKQLSTVSADTAKIDISILLSETFATINLDSSIFYFEEAFELAKSIKDSKRILSAKKCIISNLMDKGKYTDAKRYTDEGLELGYQLDDDKIICQSLINLAKWNWELSNLKESLEHLKNALKYSEKTQNLKLKADIINSFALIYGELGEREKEYDFSIQYYELSKQINDTLIQAIALNNLGYFHILQKEYSKALSYLEQSIPLAKTTIKENPFLYELVLANKGESLIELGQKELGFSILEAGLDKANQNKHPRMLVIFNKVKAKSLFNLKQFDKAIEAAKIGVSTCNETGYLKELPALCTILANSYKIKKDYQSSLIWLEEETKASQKIAERQQKKEIIQLEVNHELQQKQIENQILLLRNKNQKTFIALLITLGLICSLFISHFFRKKNQKKLEMFRQRIAADLHDEVGSNLNSITRIAKGLKSNNINPEINQGIDQLVKKSNTTIRNVIDVIWALDEEESKLEDLIEKMETYLDGIKMTNKNIEVHFIKKNIPEKMPLLINTKHHLLMVFKEALNNIQKHTHSSSIIVELKSDNQSLKMNITNHFLSKKNAVNSSGKGIINIRHRIDELGGTVEIKDAQNKFLVQVELDKIY